MKVSDLIRKLTALHESCGDLEVAVWADHGQSCETAWNVAIQYRDSSDEVIGYEDYIALSVEERGDYEKIIEVAA